MTIIKFFCVCFATLGLVTIIIGAYTAIIAATVVGGILMGYALGIAHTVVVVEQIRSGKRVDLTVERES